MGRLEKRVQRLEETVEAAGWDAAIWMLPDEDFEVLRPYLDRWEAAGGERVPQPQPTPEEARVLALLNELRRQAVARGWDESGYRLY